MIFLNEVQLFLGYIRGYIQVYIREYILFFYIFIFDILFERGVGETLDFTSQIWNFEIFSISLPKLT